MTYHIRCRDCGADSTTEDWDDYGERCPYCNGPEASPLGFGAYSMVEPGDDWETDRLVDP